MLLIRFPPEPTMITRVAPNLLRRINERRVLEVLQQHGPASRASVVRALGMTAPTVSKAVDSLLKHGLLEEQTVSSNSVGRPGKLLQIAGHAANVLGIVIDSRISWVISAGLDGMLLDERMRSFPTPDSYPALLDAIHAHAHDLMETLIVAPRAVGISVPGLVNLSEQRVALSPNLHLLDGQQPAMDLAQRLGIPCVMVQESHALCLGERMYGAAQGMDNFAMLDVSTGLGLGVVNRGQLLRGQSGLAGELGHITVDARGLVCGCGNVGCLETVATDSAFVRRISQQIGYPVDLDEAVRLIRSGQINAEAALTETCEFVAIAVAAVINVFNPSTLFLHGRLFEAADQLFDQVVERTGRRSLIPAFADCTIRKARGSKRHGAIAGIVHHVTESWAPAIF